MIDSNHYFFTLTEEQLDEAVAIMMDWDKRQEALSDGNPLIDFAYDTELQELLKLWHDNDRDMLATKLAI